MNIIRLLLVTAALCCVASAHSYSILKKEQRAQSAAIRYYDDGNYRKAFKAFDKLARKGSVLGQHNVGVMLALGQGTEVDLIESVAWLEVAASSGDRDSFELWNGLYSQLDQSSRHLAEQRARDLSQFRHTPRKRPVVLVRNDRSSARTFVSSGRKFTSRCTGQQEHVITGFPKRKGSCGRVEHRVGRSGSSSAFSAWRILATEKDKQGPASDNSQRSLTELLKEVWSTEHPSEPDDSDHQLFQCLNLSGCI